MIMIQGHRSLIKDIRKPIFKADQNIELGSQGIWVTCNRGQERRAKQEVIDLFNEVSISLA